FDSRPGPYYSRHRPAIRHVLGHDTRILDELGKAIHLHGRFVESPIRALMLTPEPLEKFIQRDIQKLLLLLGAKVYVLGTRRARGDQQGTRQSPGLPDLIAFLPARLPSRRSRILLIEVKRKGNDLSQAQFDFQTLCHAAEFAYVTGNLDRVLTWLTAEGYLQTFPTIGWEREIEIGVELRRHIASRR